MRLALASEKLAADTLSAYLNVFTHHYLHAKQQLAPNFESEAHQLLRSLRLG